jgi:hypothetical protein
MSFSPVGLQSPSEFLRHVVDADMADFGAPNQVELRLAHHACTSLLSLRDWVYETHKTKTWTFQTRQFGPISTKGRFLGDLCAIEPDFEIISDIANASKHMVLENSRKLTDLFGAANVHIQSHGGSGMLGFGALGSGAIGSLPTTSVFVQIGNHFYDVLQCAQKVHGLWKQLFAENDW